MYPAKLDRLGCIKQRTQTSRRCKSIYRHVCNEVHYYTCFSHIPYSPYNYTYFVNLFQMQLFHWTTFSWPETKSTKAVQEKTCMAHFELYTVDMYRK